MEVIDTHDVGIIVLADRSGFYSFYNPGQCVCSRKEVRQRPMWLRNTDSRPARTVMPKSKILGLRAVSIDLRTIRLRTRDLKDNHGLETTKMRGSRTRLEPPDLHEL